MTNEIAKIEDGDAQVAAPRPQRLLRLPEVMHRVGLKRSAIYQRMSEGRFPKSRSLGPKCAVWLESEVEEWVLEIARESLV
ncbi:helix-turn-helix transcriptional regulator [Croceicoccus marinus]|uniref:Transcriptional regulator n=1 Tax=Croceicoccus marinus TaxID=450378 RepID=A0A1Z1F8E1_9SPHN|nr:AlpA family transcriptional regulator [Croceicoccus marinus]ARU14994.1 transcriptional regulator [Croceicoccus marinus]